MKQPQRLGGVSHLAANGLCETIRECRHHSMSTILLSKGPRSPDVIRPSSWSTRPGGGTAASCG
jgi:hypothetical protein